eukprot:COSAG03_NODE_590_length_6826_cov_1200.670581_5_plen_73_part_00
MGRVYLYLFGPRGLGVPSISSQSLITISIGTVVRVVRAHSACFTAHTRPLDRDASIDTPTYIVWEGADTKLI